MEEKLKKAFKVCFLMYIIMVSQARKINDSGDKMEMMRGAISQGWCWFVCLFVCLFLLLSVCRYQSYSEGYPEGYSYMYTCMYMYTNMKVLCSSFLEKKTNTHIHIYIYNKR